jgi:hypothetical protein
MRRQPTIAWSRGIASEQTSRVSPSPPESSAVPPSPEGDRQCSAKGCRRAATVALAWNNPKLHTPDRRKMWLACDEHRESLSRFLDARGFLRDTISL